MTEYRSSIRLKNTWREGDNPSARFFNDLANMFTNMVTKNIKISRMPNGGLRLEANAGGGDVDTWSSGIVRWRGRQISVTNSTGGPWLRCNMETGEISDNLGPAPPIDSKYMWVRKDSLLGPCPTLPER